MAADDDPEERIRELERPLADSARASELGGSQPAGPVDPAPWTYGGPPPGSPPQHRSGNRMWWIVGATITVGVVGIAAFAAHQLSGERSIIVSPPTTSPGLNAPVRTPSSPAPPASSTPPPGDKLSVSGVKKNRTIACNDSIVSVSGVSNTVVITGHCASLRVSGIQNSITVDAVDSIAASGFNNKVIYHSGTPKVSNAGDSNVVQRG